MHDPTGMAAAALSAEALLEPLVPPPAAAGGQEEQEAGQDVRVFLPDYQGWWAPLTHLFYSSASRKLASAHPQSTSEEIESYYCPACLSYLAEAEAAQAGNRCPRCFDCPRCPPGGAAALGVVPVSADNGGGWELRCGFCGWGSAAALGLVEEDPEYVGMTLSVAEKESREEARFQHLLGVLRRQAVDRARERELGRLGLSLAAGKPSQQHEGEEGGGAGSRWRLQDLERREAEAQAAAQEGYDPKKGAVLYHQLLAGQGKGSSTRSSRELTAEGEALPADFLGLASLEEVTRGEQRLGMCLLQPRSTRELRPLRKPLLTKRSRRCLHDVALGRPGILLKPKLNPLEGDSSLRAHVGKWWQKDASAVHTLPQAAVVAAGPWRQGKPWAFLLRLSNPLPGPVRVAVVAEAAMEEDGDDGKQAPPYYLPRLRGALGGGEGQAAEAVILRSGAAAANEAVLVVLEGREDEYLEDEENGDGADPEEVEARAARAFEASLDGDGDGGDGEAPTLLAQSRHRAWLRVAVPAAEAGLASAGAAVGVLLFLRLVGERGEFAAPSAGSVASFLGQQQPHKDSEAASTVASSDSIVVPLCLAFRHQAPPSSSSTVAAAATAEVPAPASAPAAAPPRTRGQRKKKQEEQEQPAAAVAGATDTQSFFQGLLAGGGAPVPAPAPAAAPAAAPPKPAPAPATAPASSQSASAFFEGLLTGAPAPPPPVAQPARRTRAQAKKEEEEAAAASATAAVEEEAEAGSGGLVAALLSPLKGLGLGGSGGGEETAAGPEPDDDEAK